MAKFSLLLHEIAIQELRSLYDYVQSNTERLHVTPSTLDELAQVVNLQSSLDADQPNIIARFQPLQTMFSILGKVCTCCVKLNANQRAAGLLHMHGLCFAA